jgi:hypothetical protein
MSTKEPASHHPEQPSQNTGGVTGESQEAYAPPYTDDSSQEQRVFKQPLSLEDQEGIVSRSGSDRPRSKRWRVMWVSLLLLLLISTVTGIMIVPRLYRIDTTLKSVTNQTLPQVHTHEQAVIIPSPTSLPKDLARLNHLNLLLRGPRH